MKQEEDGKRVLSGEHIYDSRENSFLVLDYPYGFRLRTSIRYWIETTKRGDRFVSMTRNPKSMIWNKPKKSIYSELMRLVLDEKGHVFYDSINYNDTEDVINRFVKEHVGTLSVKDHEKAKKMIAYERGMKHIKFSVGKHKEGDKVQTREEQEKIVNQVCAYEYHKMGAGQ